MLEDIEATMKRRGKEFGGFVSSVRFAVGRAYVFGGKQD
jgi:hypothetical protein